MRLGDLTEKIISVITLGQGKKIATYIAKLRGKEDCGCNRRKEQLNNINFKSMSIVTTPLNLDWSSKWNKVREQVECSCEFDYAILAVRDKQGSLIHEEKLMAAPYMSGQLLNKDISLPSFITPHSYSLQFHKKNENEFINPININL
jgi:hypothetical protein